jgi:hypothetical protein
MAFALLHLGYVTGVVCQGRTTAEVTVPYCEASAAATPDDTNESEHLIQTESNNFNNNLHQSERLLRQPLIFERPGDVAKLAPRFALHFRVGGSMSITIFIIHDLCTSKKSSSICAFFLSISIRRTI